MIKLISEPRPLQAREAERGITWLKSLLVALRKDIFCVTRNQDHRVDPVWSGPINFPSSPISTPPRLDRPKTDTSTHGWRMGRQQWRAHITLCQWSEWHGCNQFSSPSVWKIHTCWSQSFVTKALFTMHGWPGLTWAPLISNRSTTEGDRGVCAYVSRMFIGQRGEREIWETSGLWSSGVNDPVYLHLSLVFVWW